MNMFTLLAPSHNSQVTDIPENPPNSLVLDAPPPNASDYNELLYAHLLDADGNRLTYTHFTAKVQWNSMIEITFNRSTYIKANKVGKNKKIVYLP